MNIINRKVKEVKFPPKICEFQTSEFELTRNIPVLFFFNFKKAAVCKSKSRKAETESPIKPVGL